MPPGAPFHSFALPYPIRVDAFSNITPTLTSSIDVPLPFTEPKVYLLTHTHSDHIVGLQNQSFGSTVICSADAKEMLLRHEVYKERALLEQEIRAERNRTYKHLKIDPWMAPDGTVYYQGSRDLLKPFPVNTPTRYEMEDNQEVTITLFEANHCPGAVMFLVEGSEGAILHTGDFRAEPWFLESIKHNPFLQPYLSVSDDDVEDKADNGFVKQLAAIYLDTACVFQTHEVPTKEQAVSGLISLLKLYPPTTYFFINSWTWGYEDILKAIARAFRCKIHLDRYKYNIYTRLQNDPILRSLGTLDPSETRFHACERFARCHVVDVDRDGNVAFHEEEQHGKGTSDRVVVYINPVSSMTPEGWEAYQEETKRKLKKGEVVRSLLVPLSRHSPLPELQSFVSLFRPKRVVPNTLDPSMNGLDWAGITRAFESCCHQPARASSSRIPPAPKVDKKLLSKLVRDARKHRGARVTEDEDVDEDVAIKNLVSDAGVGSGGEAGKTARKWAAVSAGAPSKSGSGRLGRRVEVLIGWLGLSDVEENVEKPTGKGFFKGSTFSKVLDSSPLPVGHHEDDYGGAGPAKGKQEQKQHVTLKRRLMKSSSDFDPDSSDDDNDERGRTAHKLFASLAEVHGQREGEGGNSEQAMLWERSSISFDFDGSEIEAEDEVDAREVKGEQGLALEDVGQNIRDAAKARFGVGIGRLTPDSSPVRAALSGSSRGVLPAGIVHGKHLGQMTPARKRKATLTSPPHSPLRGAVRMRSENLSSNVGAASGQKDEVYLTYTPRRPASGTATKTWLSRFPFSRSPIKARGRPLHFSPNSPLKSRNPHSPRTPSVQRQKTSKARVEQIVDLESPIHLRSSSSVASVPLSPRLSKALQGHKRARQDSVADVSLAQVSPIVVLAEGSKEQRPAKRPRAESTVSRSVWQAKGRGLSAHDARRVGGEVGNATVETGSQRGSAGLLMEVKNFLASQEQQSQLRNQEQNSITTHSPKGTRASHSRSASILSVKPSSLSPAQVVKCTATCAPASPAAPSGPLQTPSSLRMSPNTEKRPRFKPTRSKSEWLSLRLDLVDQLASALPEQVAPSFLESRAKMEARRDKALLRETTRKEYYVGKLNYQRRVMDEFEKANPTIPDGVDPTVEPNIDLERSRLIREGVEEDLRCGRKVILPALICAQSQDSEWG